MPYRLILHTINHSIISSPNIAPNQYSNYEDKKIIKEINKTGISMVKRLGYITSFKCKHLIEGDN